MSEVKYPEIKVRLSGNDGNAFAILGRCKRALRDARRKGDITLEEESTIWEKFKEEATNGDYDHLLCTCMDFFDVS